MLMANPSYPIADVLELSHPLPPRSRPRRRLGVERARHAFLVLAVLVLMGLHVGLNDGANTHSVTVDRMAPLLHALVLAGTGAIMLTSPVRVGRGLQRMWPFLLLPLYTGLSATWSNAPAETLSVTASLLSTLALALVCRSVVGTREACRVQVHAMLVGAGASLVAAVVIPASAFDVGDYANALRGVFAQKNQLGEVMLVGLVAWSYLVLRDRQMTWGAAATAAAALAMVLLARSMTALLLSTGVVAATGLALLWLRRSAFLLPALAAAGMAIALVAIEYLVDAGTVFAWMGKSSDLTGRSQIWATIRLMNGSPTMLGAGYSAFWTPTSPVAQAIWTRTNFVTQSAHNGYLQTRLELGNLGLALLWALTAATIVRIVRCWRSGARVSPAWALLVVAVIAIFNVDEVTWPRPDAHLFQWVLAYLSCRMKRPAPELPADEAMRRLRRDIDALGLSPRRTQD